MMKTNNKMAKNNSENTTKTTKVTKAPVETTVEVAQPPTKKRARAPAAALAVTPAAPSAAVSEPVVEVNATVADATPVTVADESAATPATPAADALETRLKALQAETNQLVRAFREYVKHTNKELASKRRKVKKVRDPNAPVRKNSGISKPMQISAELHTFLGLAPEELISRTQVSKRLIAYAQSKQLFDPANKREIIPDAALHTVLHLKVGDKVTIPSIQTYLKVHFPESQKARTERLKAQAAM